MNTQTLIDAAEPQVHRVKPTVEIFRAASAKPVEESDIMHSEFWTDGDAGLARALEAGMGSGGTVRVLYKSPEPSGMSLLYGWLKSNYPQPPHTHDCDCMYYIVSGELLYGTQKLVSGDGFFVPADTVYSYKVGPAGVEILEFRNVSRFDIKMRKTSSAYQSMVARLFKDKQQEWPLENPPVRKSRGLG